MEKIKTAIIEVSDIASQTVYYGVKFALGILIVGIILHFVNIHMFYSDSKNAFESLAMIKMSFSMLILSLITGAVVEYIYLKRNPK